MKTIERVAAHVLPQMGEITCNESGVLGFRECKHAISLFNNPVANAFILLSLLLILFLKKLNELKLMDKINWK